MFFFYLSYQSTQWVSCSLPRDLLDYVSFVPSPNDPVPVPVVSHSGRGRGRGRGRLSSGGRGARTSRGGRISTATSQLSAVSTDLDVSGEAGEVGEAGEASLELEEGDVDQGEQEEKEEKSGDSKSADGSDINTEGDIDDKIESTVDTATEPTVKEETAVTTDTTDAADGLSMDICDGEGTDATITSESAVPVSTTPVIIERDHPLFGLWTGSFDVRGVNGVLDKVQESFFFHSFMNQDPSDDLIDLPQEPQFTSLILRRNRTDVRKVRRYCFVY
jgi:hypothetical protein